jgi:hypothetical protein
MTISYEKAHCVYSFQEYCKLKVHFKILLHYTNDNQHHARATPKKKKKEKVFLHNYLYVKKDANKQSKLQMSAHVAWLNAYIIF